MDSGKLGVGMLGLFGIINDMSVSLFNVSLSVIVLSCTGACLSYAWDMDDEKPIPKKQMYKRILAITFFTTAAVAVFPAWLGWEWTPKLEGSLGLLMAASARFVVPAAVKMVPEVLRKLFRLEPKNEPDKSQMWEQEEVEETSTPKKARRKNNG